MAKSKLISRIGALALAAALACTSLISASAATIDKATIDMDAKALYYFNWHNQSSINSCSANLSVPALYAAIFSSK